MASQESYLKYFSKVDRAIAGWMYRYGRFVLRMSLVVIFVWFGALKLVNISPANDLIAHTVYWMDPKVFIPILGWWEVLIGVCLLFKTLVRTAIFLLFLQMCGTVLPLFILPDVCFVSIPFGLTLEGQYIVKNLVLISAALVIGGTVRGEEKRDKGVWV